MSAALSEEEANLATYSLQLQQVEAALTNDASNQELLKLKSDLQEIITLTQQLIETTRASTQNSTPTQDLSQDLYPPSDRKRKSSLDADQDSGASTKQSKIVNTTSSYTQEDAEGEEGDFDLQFHEIQWQPGMQCYAPWSKDGKLNGAVIKEVSQDRLTVTVAFDGYGIVEKCTTSRIKHPKQVSDFIKQRCKRHVLEMQREKKKKKTQVRMQKLKELDESKEQEKKSWKSFMNSKNLKKGVNKRSIFKSSDETRFEHGANYNSQGDCPLSKGMSSRF